MTEREILKRLGAHIAKLRSSKGISQDRIYREMGLSRGTMSKIESGSVNPQILTLVKISKAIDVPLRKLVDFDS